MKNLIRALSITLILTLTPACAIFTKAPTPISVTADVASRVEASAGQLLQIAVTARQSNQITQDQLDQVALGVDRIGRLGLDLRSELNDYSNLQAAGKDLTTIKSLIGQTQSNLINTLTDLGVKVPASTSASVSNAITSIISIVASLQGAL